MHWLHDRRLAGYILLNRAVGQRLPGLEGTAIASVITVGRLTPRPRADPAAWASTASAAEGKAYGVDVGVEDMGDGPLDLEVLAEALGLIPD